MNRIVAGAVAGLVATVAMTAAMEAMFRALPRRERYPLPPREITQDVTEWTGLAGALDEPQQQDLALASHFAFGAAAGAVYAPLAAVWSLPPAPAGIGYGLAVWAVSYLGWIPAFGILRPATEHPPRRNVLMLAAHVVWGLTTGLVTDRLMRPPATTARRRPAARPDRREARARSAWTGRLTEGGDAAQFPVAPAPSHRRPAGTDPARVRWFSETGTGQSDTPARSRSPCRSS